MIYSFARIGAVADAGGGPAASAAGWRLHEKGSKRHETPAHPRSSSVSSM
jgi:hypothetical protein